MTCWSCVSVQSQRKCFPFKVGGTLTDDKLVLELSERLPNIAVEEGNNAATRSVEDKCSGEDSVMATTDRDLEVVFCSFAHSASWSDL